MDSAWWEPLRPVCKEACLAAASPHPVEVVLFYVARWCQKTERRSTPDVEALDARGVREIAERIVRNLAEDGDRVTRLVEGDVEALTELRRLLFKTLRARGEPAAADRADEGLQKVSEVLLTGTPPATAPARLREGPDGPGNEFVFTSPFLNWARTVARNLATDEHRREGRARTPPVPRPSRRAPPIERARLIEARDALPSLIEAVRDLPPIQHAVMVASLCRADLDDVIRERLHEIAPDLFSDPAVGAPASDRDIAERLGTTPRLVSANRSVARRKLARRDHRWALLLDFLLPHRSTRPVGGEED
jgi:hypothetical protein